MGKKLYVGNLSYATTRDELEQMFASHGTVTSAQLITDRETGNSKGFGFVEMGSEKEAQSAIADLNGMNVGGRKLIVNEARPPEPRTGGGGGYGRGPGAGRGGPGRGPGGPGGPGGGGGFGRGGGGDRGGHR
ncbi:MAG: RNA-binding protein [Burkholderiaceae bacterium]